MKHLLSNAMLTGFLLAVGAAGPALADTPAKGHVCLRVRDITNSKSNRDGSAITFTMRDGKVYRNDLQGRCPDLFFNGFAWVVRDNESVCERSETLKVLHSGEICQLGNFTDITPAPAPRG